MSATSLFLQELLNAPRQVGAILPSSKNLAAAMARWCKPGDDYVLELGPGTGVVTHALFDRGLRQDRLIAVEKSPKMAEHLQERFPRANIICGDAFELETLLKKLPLKAARIGTVFSSLPLLNFEEHIADGLAQKIRALLPEKGKLVQYSYHLGSKQPKAANHFHLVASDVIWFNLPPARVSVYEK